jgi:phage baseplate assembly protein V
MIARSISKLTAPISRRVRLLARRAVVRLVYDDPKMQELQLAVFSGEVRDHVERWENYGFTSHPLPGAEAVVLSLGGSTDHGAVVAVGDRRYRITSQQPGEVTIYTDEGDTIRLRRGRVVEVNTDTMRINAGTLCEINAPTMTVNAATRVNLTTPLVAASAAMQAAADITDRAGAGGTTMAGIRTIYNGHRHPETGSTTNVPNQQM